MNLNEYLPLLIAVIVGPIAVVITAALNRKRSSADTVNAIAQGAGHAVEALQRSVNRLESELGDALKELERLSKENVKLISEVRRLTRTLEAERPSNCPACGVPIKS